MDAYIQYLDFLSYYRDVLKGNNSIVFSNSIGMGQTGIGTFSYYLASPLNFLLPLFKRENMFSFFNLIAAMKWGLAAASMNIFLNLRYRERLAIPFSWLLSFSYAWMQYDIAQSSNILWLDGVYLLPLMMVGVYKLIHDGKIWILSITTGLSIIIQWYTAGINCIFSVLWLLFEIFYLEYFSQSRFESKIKILFRYLFAMISGVMISAVLFLPTYFNLKLGRGGSLDLHMIKNEFRGNIVSVILGYTIGAKSSTSEVALFAGSIVSLGVISLFLFMKRKWIFSLLAAVILLIFYYQPFVMIFSLLKSVNSYWYRYSYVGIFALIVMAAEFYTNIKSPGAGKAVVKAAALLSVSILVLNYITEKISTENMYRSVVIIICTALVLKLFCDRKNYRIAIVIGLVLLLISELSINAASLMKGLHVSNNSEYSSYVRTKSEMLSSLHDIDDSSYRISQTYMHNQKGGNLHANYNESMNFSYNGLSSYTSASDNNQLMFLDRTGYRMEGSRMSIVNTSILPVDSLLGVKYLLSKDDFIGWERTEIENKDGLRIYANPYALPLAFAVSDYNKEFEQNYDGNPFEYVNGLFSSLTGRKEEIYKSVDFEQFIDIDDNRTEFVLHPEELKGPLYANLPWNNNNYTIDVNGGYTQDYAVWLSPSVFYVPYNENDNEIRIIVSSGNEITFKDYQFYTVDLETLGTATALLSEGVPDELQIENGSITCSVNSDTEDMKLLISFVDSDGWTIKVNDKKVIPELFADALMIVPLEKGINHVSAYYTLPGLKLGITVSVIGLMLMIAGEIILNKKHNNNYVLDNRLKLKEEVSN